MAPKRTTRSTAGAAAAPPPSTPAKKKGTKRQAPAATPVAAKKQAKGQKKGLAGSPAPISSSSLGRVDPASGLSGAILTVNSATYDVMLNLVDIAKRSDKYYVLQVVLGDDGELSVYTRWGRTGTSGSCLVEAVPDEAAAIASFAKTFKAKTGVAWEDRARYKPQPGKYEWAKVNHAQSAKLWSQGAKFQYWVDDGVAGKADGWYDYDAEASAVVEQLFHEWVGNSHMHQRVVTSGEFSYLVDLAKKTQTNVTHANHTTRFIRRWTAALGNDQTPPGCLPAAPLPSAVKQAAAQASTSTPSKAQVQAQVKAQVKAQAQTPVKSQAAVVMPMASPKVDPDCQLPNAAVYQDYSATLNQTNVGANNNKFYRLQLLKDAKLKSKNFFVWTHWGRVGENGQSKLDGGYSEEDAIDNYCKKFQSKTSNKWEQRDQFVAKAGKYDLVETDETQDEGATPAKSPGKAAAPGVACSLDATTREFVEFIFSEDMFNDAMSQFEIDVKKMPLGALSKAQVQKGYDVLVELERAIAAKKRADIEALTGRFYTVIPHAFGRQRPPIIDTAEKVKAKFEMCNVLADIETAQEMVQDQTASLTKHPTDELYESLNADLVAVAPSAPEWQVINTYFEATMRQKVKLRNVWSTSRRSEGASFSKFSALDNHKLLWHGTNIAVVAAILKGGLRIMPHSGGRVGKGIYLASEHGKSAWYVSPGSLKGKRVGVMFLAEAALGRMHVIDRDDSRLTAAPKGFESILAKGQVEPDPKRDTTLLLDGKKVTVPQGKPVPDSQFSGSSFSQSEYLVYQEAQQRLRYMLTFEW